MPKRWLRLPNDEVVEISRVVGPHEPTAVDQLRRYPDRAKAVQFAPLPVLNVVCEDHRISPDFRMGPTRLVGGTRMEFLKEFVDYEVEIEDSTWALLGIGAHHLTEDASEEEGAESTIDYGERYRMRSDLVESWLSLVETAVGPHLDTRSRIVDYKVIGSYHVVQVLGIEKTDKTKLRLDKDGNPMVYRKSGRWGKAGDPMTDPVFARNWSRADIFDYQMQLQLYRIAVEASGIAITDGTWLYIIPRDGRTQVAEGRGITHTMYFVEVPALPNEQVLAYFDGKHEALRIAVQQTRQTFGFGTAGTGELGGVEEFVREAKRLELLPAPCNDHETWNGRRCRDYCPVRNACRMAGDVKWFREKGGEETDDGLKDF